MRRSRLGLLAALGVNNFGSGLFLPVVLLYVTRVVGLPLAAAGTVVALGTVAGLAVPPAAGRLVDRVGPRRVVICAELLQVLGAVTYLAARGRPWWRRGGPARRGAAVVLQLAVRPDRRRGRDVPGTGRSPWRPWSARGVRPGCPGWPRPCSAGRTGGYRMAVIVDAGSFAGCALLLALTGAGSAAWPPGRPGRRDCVRRAVVGPAFPGPDRGDGPGGAAADFYLSGMSVYVLRELHAERGCRARRWP